MARCQKTRKVAFRTELDAKIALAEVRRKDKGQKRAYRCEFCRKWHLTSQPSRREVEGAVTSRNAKSQPSQERRAEQQ